MLLWAYNIPSKSPKEITWEGEAGGELDLVALEVDDSVGPSDKGVKILATDHFICVLMEALHIFLSVNNNKKI